MSTTYSIDFKAGGLVPLENPGLPAGTVIFYEDRANPRKDFVIVPPGFQGVVANRQAQTAICLDDGHRSEVSFCRGEFSGHWELAGRTIPEAELPGVIAAAEANGAKLKAAAEAESQARASRRAQEKSALLAEFGKLLAPVKPGQYASAALGSRNLKKHLAATFQDVKFSVTSKTYSGGDSISVRWELGPTTREVEAISGSYQEGSFNGMEDIYETNHENQWPDLFGGAKYVNESRGEGEAVNLVAAELCRRYGLPVPADGKSFWQLRREGEHSDIGSSARQLIFRQSYPAGAVIVGIEETGETCGDDILRVVFKLGDKVCTKDTPEARAAHFRARFAEWNGESKAQLRDLAKRTGGDLAELFHRFNAWTDVQFADGARTYEECSLETFCALPAFQDAKPSAPIAAPATVQDAKKTGVTVRAESGLPAIVPAKPTAAERIAEATADFSKAMGGQPDLGTLARRALAEAWN